MNQRFLDQTYYEILEVKKDAGEHEIHKAYLNAKETYSPESPALYTMFSPDEARELIRLIDEAYSVLSDYAARREYDSALLKKESPPPIESLATPSKGLPISSSPRPHPNRTTRCSHFNSTTRTFQKETLKPKLATEEGHARTRHGSYKVDPFFEKEIAEATEFDGSFLTKIRNYKQISLDHLSDEIRVSRPYLKALEGNDYKALPADVFIRGFVLQYAKALGLDGNLVANSYMRILRDARRIP